MSKIKGALVIVMAVCCAALMILPLMGRRMPVDAYEASGGAAVLPEIGLPDGTIAVNMADLYELTELPGVGETIGQRIIDERESGGYFLYPEDMLAVSGIGVKTLEGFRDLLDMTVPDGE